MIFIDLTDTSHCTANTGIQRVCRSLINPIIRNTKVQAIVFDPYWNQWRLPMGREIQRTQWSETTRSAPVRRTRWSGYEKLRGSFCRIFAGNTTNVSIKSGDIFLAPETFSPKTSHAISRILKRQGVISIAIFYDAIVEKLPQFSTSKERDNFVAYTEHLLQFSGIAAISESSKNDLLEHWRERGVTQHPPVEAILLGADFSAPGEKQTFKTTRSNTILMVGTLEPRKNHLALLKACESLWQQGMDFRLHLVGTCKSNSMAETLALLERLQQQNRPIIWKQDASNNDVHEAYQNCCFVAYPSLYEGFGLPIIEALSYGKPVVTTAFGSLREVAASGGCLLLDDGNHNTIASGIERMLKDKALLQHLEQEAHNRTLRTWADYCDDLLAFSKTLGVHDAEKHQT